MSRAGENSRHLRCEGRRDEPRRTFPARRADTGGAGCNATTRLHRERRRRTRRGIPVTRRDLHVAGQRLRQHRHQRRAGRARRGRRADPQELSSCIRKLRVNGFRDPNRAPHDRLAAAVVSAIDAGDDRLAAAMLKTWMETHATLRKAAITHLRGRGIDTPDAPEAVCDNLNTHTKGAFYEAFEPSRARELVRRIEFCYTPKLPVDTALGAVRVGRPCRDFAVQCLEVADTAPPQALARHRTEFVLRDVQPSAVWCVPRMTLHFLTLSRMVSTVVLHTNGFGSALWCLR